MTNALSALIFALLVLQGCAARSDNDSQSAASQPPQIALPPPAESSTPTGAVFDDTPISWPQDGFRPRFSPEFYKTNPPPSLARVDCATKLDGRLADCKIVLKLGSDQFANIALAWLQQPGLIFKSMTLNGAPIVGRHVFDFQLRISRKKGPALPSA